MSSVSSLVRSWTSMRSVIPISAVVALVPHEMKTVTLTQTCEKHAPKEIHFLEIDVEGVRPR
jgi:hypothetical protein